MNKHNLDPRLFWGSIAVAYILLLYAGLTCSFCDAEKAAMWEQCMRYKSNPVIERTIGWEFINETETNSTRLILKSIVEKIKGA